MGQKDEWSDGSHRWSQSPLELLAMGREVTSSHMCVCLWDVTFSLAHGLSSWTSSDPGTQGCQQSLVICWGRRLAAADGHIKFCSAAHLVAVLADRENSLQASSGLWTSHSASI
jgi:hypothetical protein